MAHSSRYHVLGLQHLASSSNLEALFVCFINCQNDRTHGHQQKLEFGVHGRISWISCDYAGGIVSSTQQNNNVFVTFTRGGCHR